MNNTCKHIFRFNDTVKDRCDKCMMSRGDYLVQLIVEKRSKFPHIHVYDKYNTCIAGKMGKDNKLYICKKKFVF